MKLNESKQELRNLIEMLILQNQKELVKKIELDPALLEDLLFYKVKITDSSELSKKESPKEYFIKFPIWTGSFLKYIDLHQVSYDHVCWNLDVLQKHEKGYDKEPFRVYDIIMEKTNAIIDFKKAYKSETISPMIFRCTFDGTNLFNQTLAEEKFDYCSFKNTGINIEVSEMTYSLIQDIKTGIFDGCFINGKSLEDKGLNEDIISAVYGMDFPHQQQEIMEAFQKAKR